MIINHQPGPVSYYQIRFLLLYRSSIENTDSSSSFMADINIVLVTQLREEVEALKKSLASKEKLLLEKERKVCNVIGDLELSFYIMIRSKHKSDEKCKQKCTLIRLG